MGRRYRKDNRRERNKAYVWIIKMKKGCEICGESYIPRLTFHHLKPRDKVNNISCMIANKTSLITLKKEIDKCIVVCESCHRKMHSGHLMQRK